MRFLNSSLLILSALFISPSFALSHSSKPIERDVTSSQHSSSRSVLSSSNQRLRLRDASTVMSGGDNNEGAAHHKLNSPDGSFMKDLQVGDNGDEIMLYWSRGIEDAQAEQAFVMIHGKLRDGDNYWTIMNEALQSAVADGVEGASSNSLVVAPQFFSTRYNSGQYSKSELAWGDVNGWQAGDSATHPDGTTLTSFDALDAIIEEFSNQTHYSSLKNLTLVGHGGGGQLLSRYAVVGEDGPEHLHIRYVTGDPSSNIYFGTERPQGTGISASDCELYDTWRYGFTNFTGTLQGKKEPQEYFEGYVKRDLVALVANDDTSPNGDQYCMAQMQGGVARRDRNLAYFAYIQSMAGTGFDLTNWPVSFDSLPNWSHLTGNWTNHNLVVIENIGHNPDQVFGSELGRSALFESDKTKIKPGWRPSSFDFKLNRPISSLTSDVDDVNKDQPTSTPLNSSNNNHNSPDSENTVSSTSSAISGIQFVGLLSLLSFFSVIFVI